MKPGAESWKMSAAKTLKKKITEMAWATSFSLAWITGAVAAMAEPPQIEEPTPIKVASLCPVQRNAGRGRQQSRLLKWWTG